MPALPSEMAQGVPNSFSGRRTEENRILLEWIREANTLSFVNDNDDFNTKADTGAGPQVCGTWPSR